MATITTADLALELGTDARTTRRFLRADAASRDLTTPGKGSKWAIERRDVRPLKARFAKWEAAQEAAKAARAEAKAQADDAEIDAYDAPEAEAEAIADLDALHPADIDDEAHPDA